MSTKMSLVFLKDTGSILAYATRTAMPPVLAQLGALKEEDQKAPKAQELAELAGTKLLFRYPWDPTVAGFKAAEFDAPGEDLDVVIADLDAAVTDDPRAHYVDADGEIAAVGGKVKDISGVAAEKVKVEVYAAISGSARKVWLRVRGTSEEHSRIATGTIEVTKTDAELSIQALPPGDYLAFAAVAGLSPIAKKITIQ